MAARNDLRHVLDFKVTRNTDLLLMESYHRDSQREHRAPLVSKQEMNMSKKFKLAFLAAVLAVIGAISSPVLADQYDPTLNGGGSNGYDATLGAGHS